VSKPPALAQEDHDRLERVAPGHETHHHPAQKSRQRVLAPLAPTALGHRLQRLHERLTKGIAVYRLGHCHLLHKKSGGSHNGQEQQWKELFTEMFWGSRPVPAIWRCGCQWLSLYYDLIVRAVSGFSDPSGARVGQVVSTFFRPVPEAWPIVGLCAGSSSPPLERLTP